MKKIQVLGTGCSKCKTLFMNAGKAVEELGLEAELEHVEDIEKILSYGIMMTPGLVIDGIVVSSGKMLSVNEVKQLLGE